MESDLARGGVAYGPLVDQSPIEVARGTAGDVHDAAERDATGEVDVTGGPLDARDLGRLVHAEGEPG